MKETVLETCGLLSLEELGKVGFIYRNGVRSKFRYFRRLNFDSEFMAGFTKPRYEGEISKPECFRYDEVLGLFIPFNDPKRFEESLDWLESPRRCAYGLPVKRDARELCHRIEGMPSMARDIRQICLSDVVVLENYGKGNNDLKQLEYFETAHLKGAGLIDEKDKLFKAKVVRAILSGEPVDFHRLA